MTSRLAVSAAALLAAGCLETPNHTGSGDAGSGDAGPTGPPCGSVAALSETFEIDSWVWNRYGDAFIGGDRLQAYAPPMTSSGAITGWSYGLAGSDLLVQMKSVSLGDGELRLGLVNAVDDFIGLELAGESLTLVQDAGGEVKRPIAVVHTPDLLWWRLTEVAGEMHLSTSTSGEGWTDQGSTPVLVEGPVQVLVDVEAGKSQSVVEVEAINATSTEGLCPAGSLSDEFTGESPRWLKSSEVADCTVTTAGALAIRYDGTDSCGLGSAEHFDLRGSQFGLEVVEARDCDPTFYFTVWFDQVDAEFMCANDGGGPILFAQIYGQDAPGELASVSFDPENHRLLRIRHEQGQQRLVFETASLEADWEDLAATVVSDAEVSSVGVGVYVGEESPDTTVDPVVFDRLNLLP